MCKCDSLCSKHIIKETQQKIAAQRGNDCVLTSLPNTCNEIKASGFTVPEAVKEGINNLCCVGANLCNIQEF